MTSWVGQNKGYVSWDSHKRGFAFFSKAKTRAFSKTFSTSSSIVWRSASSYNSFTQWLQKPKQPDLTISPFRKNEERNKRFFVLQTGNTLNSHKDVIDRLNKQVRLQEVSTVAACDFILVFCPVVLQAGTDIEAAVKKLNHESDTKPAVLVVLHHTFDPECVVPDSSRAVHRTNTITVDCLFHEDKGLLQCHKNTESLSITLDYINPQGKQRESACIDTGIMKGNPQGHHDQTKNLQTVDPGTGKRTNEAEESDDTQHMRDQQLRSIYERLQEEQSLMERMEKSHVERKKKIDIEEEQLKECKKCIEKNKTNHKVLFDKYTELERAHENAEKEKNLHLENINKLQSELKNKDEELKTSENKSQKLEQELQDMKRQLHESNTALAKKKEKLEETERLLSEKDRELREKDRPVIKSAKTLQERERSLKQKDTQFIQEKEDEKDAQTGIEKSNVTTRYMQVENKDQQAREIKRQPQNTHEEEENNENPIQDTSALSKNVITGLQNTGKEPQGGKGAIHETNDKINEEDYNKSSEEKEHQSDEDIYQVRKDSDRNDTENKHIPKQHKTSQHEDKDITQLAKEEDTHLSEVKDESEKLTVKEQDTKIKEKECTLKLESNKVSQEEKQGETELQPLGDDPDSSDNETP